MTLEDQVRQYKLSFFFGFLVGLQSPLPPPSSSLCTYLLQQSAKRDTCRYSCDSGPVLFRSSPWPQHLRSMVTEIPKTWNMPSICLCEYVKTALLFSIIDCLGLVVARAQSPSAQFSGALVFGSLDYIFHEFSSVNYHIKFSARQFRVVQQLRSIFFTVCRSSTYGLLAHTHFWDLNVIRNGLECRTEGW